MRTDLIRRFDELSGLAERWDELALLDRRDGFFRTSGWYLAWMHYIRPDAEPFIVVARDGSGRVVGLAPMCRLEYHDSGLKFTSLAWAGREVVSGDFLDFVCDPGMRDQAIAAMLDRMWQERHDWSMLVMGELTTDGDSLPAVDMFAQNAGIPVRRQEERLCPYIALPATFDAYLNTLGSSTRYHIRRRTRDLDKRGTAIEVYSQPEDVAAHVDAMMQLHIARWRKENQSGTFGRPGFAEFMRQICSNPPRGSCSRLYMLRHEGKPIASLLTFRYRQSTLYYQAGWDPDSEMANLSPGVVLMAHSIKDAIEDGAKYYEFLRGDEAYKSRWTKSYRTTTTILVAQSFVARQFLRVARIKDLVKSRVGQVPAATESLQSGNGAYGEV